MSSTMRMMMTLSCTTAAHRLEVCITDVQRWMEANRLKLNTDKTELLWAGSSSTVSERWLPSNKTIANSRSLPWLLKIIWPCMETRSDYYDVWNWCTIADTSMGQCFSPEQRSHRVTSDDLEWPLKVVPAMPTSASVCVVDLNCRSMPYATNKYDRPTIWPTLVPVTAAGYCFNPSQSLSGKKWSTQKALLIANLQIMNNEDTSHTRSTRGAQTSAKAGHLVYIQVQ